MIFEVKVCWRFFLKDLINSKPFLPAQSRNKTGFLIGALSFEFTYVVRWHTWFVNVILIVLHDIFYEPVGICNEIVNLVSIILKFRFKVLFALCVSFLKYWLCNSRETYLARKKWTSYGINRPEIALKLNGKISLFDFIFRNAILSIPVLTYNWQPVTWVIIVFSRCTQLHYIFQNSAITCLTLLALASAVARLLTLETLETLE